MSKLAKGPIGYETHFPYTFTVPSFTYALQFTEGMSRLDHWERDEINDLLLSFAINIDKRNPNKIKQQEIISKYNRSK